MKPTRVLIAVVVLILVACSAPAPVVPLQPVSAAGPTQPTAVPSVVLAAPAAASSSLPAVTRGSLSSASSTDREKRTGLSSAPFDIGVPAGDAYYPYSVAVDAARNLAYVYHAGSAEKRPVISVVDLAAGKVTRLIRLQWSDTGASGRLFITRDGRRLYLQESQHYTVSSIELASGAIKQLLTGVRDAALSDDARMLYAVEGDRLAAYAVADLTRGQDNAIWEAKGSFARVMLNGNRLLVVAYGTTGTLTLMDAATGKPVATGDLPDSLSAFAPGPDGGWGVVVGGERPSLLRYDASLKRVGDTAAIYTSQISYDSARKRYLLGGLRYSSTEPRGRQVILSVPAEPGGQVTEERWAGGTAPTTFVAWGQAKLIAFAEGGPALLSVIDAASLKPSTSVAMGVRAQNLIIDDASQTLYVSDDLGSIHVLGLPGGDEEAIWEGQPPLALDAKNGRLYANRSSGVVALDAKTGALLAQFGQAGYPGPDPAADLVYIADNGVTMYDRAGNKLGTLPSTFPVERGMVPNPYAYAVYVNPVTGHVAVVMHNGIPGSNGGSFLRVYSRRSDTAEVPSAPHSFVMDVTTDREGNWYVSYSTARYEEAVQVLSPQGKLLRRLDRRTGYLALDEATDSLYLFLNSRVTRLAASTLTPAAVFEGPEVPGDFALSPANNAVYLAGGNSPLITSQSLANLSPLDLRPVPARPAPDASNDSLTVLADGRKRMVYGRFNVAYRTPDGQTWERLLPGAEFNWGNVTAVDRRTLFLTGQSPSGGEGVWRSTDGGNTWEWLVAGLTDLSTNYPVLANGPDEAYFINRSQGLLRWNATARKWEVVSKPARDGQWGPVTLAPDGTLFRSNDGYLESSSDGGRTWSKLGSSDKTGDVIGFSSLYTVTHTLFSVVRSGYQISGLQRSTDGGKTWQASNLGSAAGFDGYQPELVTGFGSTYLLLRPYNGQPSLLRTSDYGETWQVAPDGAVTGVDHVAIDPLDGRLWLGVKGGVKTLDPQKLKWSKPTGATSVPPGATVTPKPPATQQPAPTATASPCTMGLSGGDAEINARGLGLGCPKGAAQSVQMARQRFQYGQMIWRADRRLIYVLQATRRWQVLADTWLEGDPVDDPSIAAPSGGLQQPVRGFGKVWRLGLGGPKAAVGWAVEKESGVIGLAQDWDHGTVLRFGGEVIVLLDGGEWK